MNTKMKLFWAAPSPFSRQVRVLLRELDLADTVEEIAVHTTPTSPSELVRTHNPLVKIPTLVTSEGLALYDSRVILDYLVTLRPGVVAVAPAGQPAWQASCRLALVDGILDACLLHRYETVLRPEAMRWPEWLEAQHRKIVDGLAALAADGPVAGARISIDAIAVASMLAWLDFRMPTLDWRTNHPTLAQFLDEVARRPSMLETRPE